MKEISSTVEINAAAEHVWRILTDAERPAEWNPFLLKLSGVLKPGEKLDVQVQLPARSRCHFVRPFSKRCQIRSCAGSATS